MSEKWIGSIVSIDCGDVLGIYEGEISNVDGENQTISLINVSRNKIKSQFSEITLNTCDIKDIKFLQSTASDDIKPSDIGTNDVSAFVRFSGSHNGCTRNSPQQDDNSKKKNEGKKKNLKKLDVKKWQKEKDEACFSAPVDSDVFNTEFDFEKNLALFDKRAVFDEINALNKSDHIKLVDCNKRASKVKYRHDENILSGDELVLNHISVPCKSEKAYVTDTDLIVPSVSLDFKKQLFKKAEKAGLTLDVQLEMIGRAASEMVLQLLGGSHRLNPLNTHQRPTVVILSGSHMQGAQGINCGRHLSNHCANVTVICPPNCQVNASAMARELTLFALTDGKTTNKVSELPTTVDIIISALDAHEASPCDNQWLSGIKQWAKQCKASVLCLDPPPRALSLESKWILAPALPFAFADEKSSIYICDIGIPRSVFLNTNCAYVSPFGSKFVIPLYTRTS